MQILDNAISWGRANLNIVIAAIVFGVVQFVLTMIKLQYLLGLATAIAYLAARFTEVALHPKVTTPDTPAAARRRI